MRIVIIGGGSVGANIAYRLVKEGAEIVVVDAGIPGGGTTGSSIAWLSHFPQTAWKEPHGQRTLRLQTDGWFHDIEESVPGEYVTWSGTLLWGHLRDSDGLKDAAAVSQRKGIDVREINSAEAHRLEPNIEFNEGQSIFWEPSSGWVDGPALCDALLTSARDMGADIKPKTDVVGINTSANRVVSVETDSAGTIPCDAVVNAAGNAGSHIAALADLAIPMHLTPGRIIYTEPVEGLPRTVVNAPEWCARPDPSGGLAIHWRGGPQEPGHGPNIRDSKEVIEQVSSVIPSLERSSPARTTVGIRPVPPGGPVIGTLPWLPNFYFALSHGGIGWGPTWASIASRELLNGEHVDEVSDMRPERFYLDSTMS